MPPYPWLLDQEIDLSQTAGKISALRTLGVPYPEGYEETANDDLDEQATAIVQNLSNDGIETINEAEIVALIAYMQRLGIDIKGNKTALKLD
jgi:cytochrome c oxidase cbb3-type subunit I/II